MRQKSDNPCKNSYKNKAYSSSFSGFPGGTVIKNLPANVGDTGDASLILVLGRSPGVGNGNPAPVFFPGKFHGQRNLAGYSPWGCKRVGHD